MIENKNQFKKAIKENKIKEIKRIYNFNKENKIKENEKAILINSQSNCFQLKWDCLEKATYTYFDDIEVKNNKYYFFNLLSEKFNHDKIEILKSQNIELIPLTEKEKEKYNKFSNSEYCYKIIVMINEIIEK